MRGAEKDNDWERGKIGGKRRGKAKKWSEIRGIFFHKFLTTSIRLFQVFAPSRRRGVEIYYKTTPKIRISPRSTTTTTFQQWRFGSIRRGLCTFSQNIWQELGKRRRKPAG